MNGGFKKLDRDDDVLLFDKNTYTVGLLNEIVKEQIHSRIYALRQTYKDKSERIVIAQTNASINIPSPGISLKLKESKWNASTQEIDAKILLGDGSKGWQTGKLRMKVDVIFFPEEYSSFDSSANLKTEIKIDLEFRPDEPVEPTSPLDDIRQREDYKKLQ